MEYFAKGGREGSAGAAGQPPSSEVRGAGARGSGRTSGPSQASATYKSDVDDEASSAQGPSQLGNTQAPSPRASQLAGQPAGHLEYVRVMSRICRVRCLVSDVRGLSVWACVGLCGSVSDHVGDSGCAWLR